MIYRHTVRTKCVPSGFSTVMWQGCFIYSYVAGLKRCLLWCRVKSRLLTNADHGIMVHSNLYAVPIVMLLEGTSDEHSFLVYSRIQTVKQCRSWHHGADQPLCWLDPSTCSWKELVMNICILCIPSWLNQPDWTGSGWFFYSYGCTCTLNPSKCS